MTTENVSNNSEGGIKRWLLSPRPWIAAVAIAAWLVSMHAVWRHEAGRGGHGIKQLGLSPDVLLVTWTNYEHLMWIIQNDRRIGATHMTIFRREVPDAPTDQLPGYDLASRTRIKLSMFGIPVNVDMTVNVGMNGTFEMETFQAVILAAGQPMRLDGFVEDNRLYYRARIGGESKTGTPKPQALQAVLADRDICGRSPISGPILMDDVLLPLLIHEGKLKPGQNWSTETSDLISGMLKKSVRVNVVGRENIHIGDKEIPAWHLTERVGEVQSQAYYSTDGQLLRRDAPGGLTMLQANAEELKKFDPGFGRTQESKPIDRDYIRTHIDPNLDDKPLESLLPNLPSF